MKKFMAAFFLVVMLLGFRVTSRSFGETHVMRSNVRYICKHCKNPQEFIVRFRIKKCKASPTGEHEYVLYNNNLPTSRDYNDSEDNEPLQINF